MQYALLDYVTDAGWTQLSPAEQDTWLGAYQAYLDAMVVAGVLTTTMGLHPAAAATTVRVAHGTTQVLDGPYADTKEQLGGLHIIEIPDLA
ncbi:MAG TPA: YciI family protein, partial [Herpetosiphonaceae bacterium]